jgi:hypothetical protein
MQSGMTHPSRNHATITFETAIAAHPLHLCKRISRAPLRAALAAVMISLVLSDCGMFCGGAGGSGGGFAGGCATGMRF